MVNHATEALPATISALLNRLMLVAIRIRLLARETVPFHEGAEFQIALFAEAFAQCLGFHGARCGEQGWTVRRFKI